MGSNQADDPQNARNVIDRIKQAFRLRTDAEVAEILSLSPSTLASWKSRNSLDYGLLVAKCKDLNLNWVFLGEGEMYPVKATWEARVVSEAARLKARIKGIENALNETSRRGGMSRERIDAITFLLSRVELDLGKRGLELERAVFELQRVMERINSELEGLEEMPAR